MSTRSQKKSSSVSSVSLPSKRVENSWVAIVKEPLFENCSFSIVTLPHPASGKPTKYCLDDAHNKVYEIVTFNEPCRSWFIQETVKSDGTLLMMTPVNPLFLVLPKLRNECNSRAIPLEDLLAEQGYNKILDFVTSLHDVADSKGSSELKAYKYNEEKTLNWLEERVRKLAIVLKNKNVHVTSGAISATFVASSLNNDTIDEECYLKYAHGLVSEYLEEDLAEKLANKFNFQAEIIETLGKKRKSEVIVENRETKKMKSETQADAENMPLNGSLCESKDEVKKQKPLSAKDKARQKAASGTKTISSFFMKK